MNTMTNHEELTALPTAESNTEERHVEAKKSKLMQYIEMVEDASEGYVLGYN